MTPPEIDECEARGLWRKESLRSLLAETAAQHPQRLAAVGYVGRTVGNGAVLTYVQFDKLVSELAGGLNHLGIDSGDLVAVMMHNRVEFGALIFAINHLGAAYTGIPPTYARREVEQILGQSDAKLVIVDSARALGVIRELQDSLPALEHAVVLTPIDAGEPAGPRELPYESLLGHGAAERRDDYRSICHVGFTSGTTGAPKGVMNTAQTLDSILRNWVEHVGGEAELGQPVVNLVASTVGHHTGFCWGVLMSACLGGSAVYLDRWEAATAWHVIDEQQVTTLFGAPTFVQDLMSAAAHRPVPETSLRMIVVAGAPVVRALPAAAGRALDCVICPAWGMTEYGIGISWAPRLGERARQTDGTAVSGAEIRIATETGEPAAPGGPGELQLRGAGLFLGYKDRPEENEASFDGDWFRTGDTATIDEQGLVRLVGRIKDIIIRGGENIPVVEVESLLFDHPKVRDVAIVGVPDARLGQRAGAVVVPGSNGSPSLEELCWYLLRQGLSKRFLPERLELVSSLPRTASGKVRKVELRELFI